MTTIENLTQKAIDLGKTETGGQRPAGNFEAHLDEMFAAELYPSKSSTICSTPCGSEGCCSKD